MRRLVLAVPLLVSGVLLAGCAQLTHAAGEAVGIPVAETCTTIDDAYAQYQALLDQGGASAEQVDAARDDLVATLDGLSDDVGGELGGLLRSGAQQLGGLTDLRAPETIEAVERLKEWASAFCG